MCGPPNLKQLLNRAFFQVLPFWQIANFARNLQLKRDESLRLLLDEGYCMTISNNRQSVNGCRRFGFGRGLGQ